MAAKKKKVGFTPFKAPKRPPPGYFDPALEQQRRAAARGYQDLSGDTALASSRGQEDLGISQGNRAYARDTSLADLLTAETRARTSHDEQTGELTRQYGILGSNQAQAGNAAGLSLGGYMEAAANIRGANQRHDQVPIDEALTHTIEDIGTQRTRVQDAYDQGVSADALSFTRNAGDLATQLGRGGRELAAQNQDLTESEFAQAGQAGYTPPSAPRNEFSRRGVTYRRVRGGFMLPNGRIINHRQLQAMYH